MNEIADSSEGASSGISAILRNKVLKRMQLRVSAYANVKAAGTVISMTSPDTHTLFQIDCDSAGV